MHGIEVSVVCPAYNEEDTIKDTITILIKALSNFLSFGSFEIIIVEDGCDDRTPEIVRRLSEQKDQVRHIHNDERLGRGGALSCAFEQARGDVLVYLDTDMATDIQHLKELVEAVRSDGYDIATGSRLLPESKADRPAKRGILSIGYNILVQTLLQSDIQDHQCGFKSFDREAVDSLLPVLQDEHWFWDTEILVKAQRRDYHIKEFPVDWEPKGDSKVDIVRDVLGMGSQIIRMFWQLSVSPRITRQVSLGAGTILIILALLLMTQYLSPQVILRELTGATPEIVVLSAFIYTISWPIRGLRHRDILKSMGFHEQWGFLTGAVFVSQTGNLVFPARLGDGVRAYVVKIRRSIPYSSGFASLAVERVFDLLTITTLAGIVTVGLVLTGSISELLTAMAGSVINDGTAQSGQTAVYLAIAVGFAAIGAVTIIVVSARIEANFVRTAISQLSDDSYANYVASIIEEFVVDVQTVTTDWSTFLRVGISSLGIWSLDVLTALIIFTAFDYSLTPSLVAVGFFAVSVGNLAKVLPLTPGGVGLYEGAFTIIIAPLTPVGVTTALSVAIVDHSVKNIVTIFGGIVSMAWLNVSLTTAVEQAQTVDKAVEKAE